MKKHLVYFVFLICLLCANETYSQEKYIKECSDLVSNGYYHAAKDLVEELLKLKKEKIGLVFQAHILFKERNYDEAKKIYETIKKIKGKKKLEPNANYYLDLKDIYTVEMNFEKALGMMFELESKIESMDENNYKKYIELYYQCRECLSEKNNMIGKIQKEKDLLQKLIVNLKIPKDTIEYERFEKKSITTKHIFTGIGFDESNQLVASLKNNQDKNTNNTKDKRYYNYYGFKYLDESISQNEIILSPTSKFFVAGIAFDKINQEYIYSKQESEWVELKKKEIKKLGLTNFSNNLTLYRTKTLSEEGEKLNNDVNNAYDFLNPAISENGKYMYFSSNYENTDKTNYDIFFVEKNQNGTWDFSQIKKLPAKYNTPFNELYPTISGDTLLTISSNGFGIQGGFDIIGIRLNNGLIDTNTFIVYQYPINSKRDDFGYKFEKERVAIFFSNRDDYTQDELYEIEYKLPFVKLIVKVKDKNTLQPLDEFNLTLKTDNAEKKYYLNQELSIDSLLPKNIYQLTINKDKYIIVNNNQEVKYSKNEKEKIVEFFAYKKLEKKDKIEFKDILFEYNKADLLPESYVELNKILQIIKDNPYAKLELSAHTDSRGKDSYNLKLSQKRAESCVKYLLSQGVSKDMLTAKGYGEKQLKNKCSNNVKCSEEEHAINRRVEIKVLDVK